MIIEYKGQTIDTIYHKEMSQELYEQLVKEHYAKPTEKEIVNEIATLVSCKGVKMSCIEQNWFRELMDNTQVYYNKWSIKDVFDYKPLLERFYAQTFTNDKVFTSDSILSNIETAIRLGGKGVASKVANYPIKNVEEIFKRYNVNNNYYDMSCGWGGRLVASLKNRVNYYGTDPNYLLVEKLKDLQRFWKEHTLMPSVADIRCQGSETLVNEWIGKMGLCFTSPPYFYLEDYKIGNQSWKKGTTYQEWLENYLKPTLENCFKYLIDNGYLVINIKDFDKWTLEKDTIRIAEQCGFKFIEYYYLDNITRIKSDGNLGDSDENIMVFMKKGHENEHKHWENEQLTLF